MRSLEAHGVAQWLTPTTLKALSLIPSTGGKRILQSRDSRRMPVIPKHSGDRGRKTAASLHTKSQTSQEPTMTPLS